MSRLTNPQRLEKEFTYRQLRKMYTTAARQARQAYREVAAAYPKSAATGMYKGDFKSFTTISKYGMKKTELAKQLASVNRYLDTPASSVERYGAQRSEIVATFQSHGYNVTEENFDEVGEFMKDVTERGLKSIYGSDQLLLAFNRAKRRGITKEQFSRNVERWTENADAVANERKSGKLRVIAYKNSSDRNF